MLGLMPKKLFSGYFLTCRNCGIHFSCVGFRHMKAFIKQWQQDSTIIFNPVIREYEKDL